MTGNVPGIVNAYASGKNRNQGTPPTVAAIRAELDANCEKLAEISPTRRRSRASFRGTIASSEEATAIQNNTRVVRVVTTVIERPDTGTMTYRVELLLYDAIGNMEAPDASPTVELVNQAGTDRSSRLDATTMALVATGRYRTVYTASADDDLEQLVWVFQVTEGGETRVYGNTSLIVDTTAVDFTAADRLKLDAVHANADVATSSRAAPGDAMGATAAAISAIRSGLSTFDPSTEAVLLAASQTAYAPAKAGDAMTLTSEERTAIATALLQLANGTSRASRSRRPSEFSRRRSPACLGSGHGRGTLQGARQDERPPHGDRGRIGQPHGSCLYPMIKTFAARTFAAKTLLAFGPAGPCCAKWEATRAAFRSSRWSPWRSRGKPL